MPLMRRIERLRAEGQFMATVGRPVRAWVGFYVAVRWLGERAFGAFCVLHYLCQTDSALRTGSSAIRLPTSRSPASSGPFAPGHSGLASPCADDEPRSY